MRRSWPTRSSSNPSIRTRARCASRALAARFERTPAALSRFAPLLGEHTNEVLAEAGVASSELAALREQGVIA